MSVTIWDLGDFTGELMRFLGVFGSGDVGICAGWISIFLWNGQLVFLRFIGKDVRFCCVRFVLISGGVEGGKPFIVRDASWIIHDMHGVRRDGISWECSD